MSAHRLSLPRLSLPRLAGGLGLLGLCCACGVIPTPFDRPPAASPPVVTAPPVPPPTPPVPVSTPTLPTTLPSIPGFPTGLPPGFPSLPTTMPQPGASLLSHDPPPDYATLAAPPRGSTDSNGSMQMTFLRGEVETVYREVLADLSPDHRSRVERIPFHVIDDPREPNAAAGCSPGSRAPMVMITTPMLTLCAATSEALAYDELAHTTTYETYASSIGDMFQRGSIRGLAPGVLSGPLATDPRKLARQRHLFDQQVAFILGHELAHHYRGHTGCAPGGGASEAEAEQLQRQLAQAAPPLEQPFEIEADMWGVTTVLESGHERVGGVWSEEGALLSLDTFRHISEMNTADLPMLFLSTHPPSMVRAPLVQSVADGWTPGRVPLPTPTIDSQGLSIDLGGGTPIHIPIPFGTR